MNKKTQKQVYELARSVVMKCQTQEDLLADLAAWYVRTGIEEEIPPKLAKLIGMVRYRSTLIKELVARVELSPNDVSMHKALMHVKAGLKMVEDIEPQLCALEEQRPKERRSNG